MSERHPEPAPVDAIAHHLEGIIDRLLVALLDESIGDDDINDAEEEWSRSVRELIYVGAPLARISDSVLLAHESVVRSLVALAIAQGASAATLTTIAVAATRSMDSVLTTTFDHYLRETQRFSLSAERARQEVIDLLIGGATVDHHTVYDVLGTRLEDYHLGLVVSGAASRVDRHTLRRSIDVVRRMLRHPSVVVQENQDALWVWASSRRPLRLDASQLAVDLGGGLRVGVGASHRSAAGFRRTHLEALAAHRSGHPGATGVVEYVPGALTILLGADAERARWFVEHELGPLVTPGPRNHELLLTLRCFFECRMRVSVAAQKLHIHRNTAIARLSAVEQMLGHPLEERAVELQAALALLDHLGEDET